MYMKGQGEFLKCDFATNIFSFLEDSLLPIGTIADQRREKENEAKIQCV